MQLLEGLMILDFLLRFILAPKPANDIKKLKKGKLIDTSY
jgi:hypothetical protein